MLNPTDSSAEQTAAGNGIAQATDHSSATVTQYNFNVRIDNIEQFNLVGSLLPKDLSGIQAPANSAVSVVTHEAAQSRLVADEWERGRLIYELNLGGDNQQIEAAVARWGFASSSIRQPLAAIAQGAIGIGHDDGVTFNLAPVDPIDNCSVECELRIINYGDDQSNWGGIRVRGFNFCPDFRLGYLVYLRQSRTVDLYGPHGVIDGDKEVKIDDTNPWTRLRVDIFDSQIQVYINGDRRISVVDKNFGNRGLIYLHTFHTHTQFRNFRAYEMTRQQSASS